MIISDTCPDLLHHIVDPQGNKSPVVVPVSVDWFRHPTPPPRQSTVYISPLKDHWCQWNTAIPKLPEIKQCKKDLTFPPVTKRDDVDFARLLALDYQREWLQKRQDKKEKQERSAKVRVS